MLAIDRLTPPEAAAHQCRGPRYQILDGEHVEVTDRLRQLGSPQETSAGHSEQVDADRTRLVDQLQQRPAVIGIPLNVMLQECAGNGLGD